MPVTVCIIKCKCTHFPETGVINGLYFQAQVFVPYASETKFLAPKINMHESDVDDTFDWPLIALLLKDKLQESCAIAKDDRAMRPLYELSLIHI